MRGRNHCRGTLIASEYYFFIEKDVIFNSFMWGTCVFFPRSPCDFHDPIGAVLLVQVAVVQQQKLLVVRVLISEGKVLRILLARVCGWFCSGRNCTLPDYFLSEAKPSDLGTLGVVLVVVVGGPLLELVLCSFSEECSKVVRFFISSQNPRNTLKRCV